MFHFIEGKRVIIRTDAAGAATSGLEAELKELSGNVKEAELKIAETLREATGRLSPTLVHRAYSRLLNGSLGTNVTFFPK